MEFAYGHDSARIGQANDGLQNGIVTHVNHTAKGFAGAIGDSVQTLVARLRYM